MGKMSYTMFQRYLEQSLPGKATREEKCEKTERTSILLERFVSSSACRLLLDFHYRSPAHLTPIRWTHRWLQPKRQREHPMPESRELTGGENSKR